MEDEQGHQQCRRDKRQGSVDTAKEKGERSRGGDAKGGKAPPTTFPPKMRAGDGTVQVKVPPQRKQPPLVEHRHHLDLMRGEQIRQLGW